LESFLPPSLQFSRPTISPSENTIHGSISTNDIAAALRAIASANGEKGSRVVISPDMISFTDELLDGGSDKVKTIGKHNFQICLKGAPNVIRRTLVISPQISLD
jgi:hypothetical protein